PPSIFFSKGRDATIDYAGLKREPHTIFQLSVLILHIISSMIFSPRPSHTSTGLCAL
ncbi:unnamed protein product, partial [Mycena citricolor]